MTPEAFAELVDAARLSPSVHNIQPTRWRLVGEVVHVLQAPGRTLPAGDPSGRDVAASHGSAVEGFVIAAGATGWKAEVTRLTEGDAVAAIHLSPGGGPDPLAPHLSTRRTYRGKFSPPSKSQDGALTDLGEAAPDLMLATSVEDIAAVAALNDEATLRTFRNRPFRAELLSWMRLSRRHPDWARDGLNARAMEMGGLEAAAAGIVLKPGVFEALDGVGAAGAATSEAQVVRSALAVALFHRPLDEDPFETGRAWHRTWLHMERVGFSAAPMTVLGDDAGAAAALASRFGLPADRRLVTVFRLGVAPAGARAEPARLPLNELIV